MKLKQLLDFSSLWIQINSQWYLYFIHSNSCLYLFVSSSPPPEQSLPEPRKCRSGLSVRHIHHAVACPSALAPVWMSSPKDPFVGLSLLPWCQHSPWKYSVPHSFKILCKCLVRGLNQSCVSWKNRMALPSNQCHCVTWDTPAVLCSVA